VGRHRQQNSVINTYLDAEEEALGHRLVTFSLPENATPAESGIAKDFVRIDHRSLRTLGSTTQERGEVRDLLVNVAGFLQNRQTDAARALLSHTEAVYYQHIQAKNRLRYLVGVLVGILAFGVVLVKAQSILQTTIPPSLLAQLLLFAGMGTITSELTRLSSIDLRDQTSLWMVYVSGMARPVTSVFFALVVYLVVALRIVDLHLGVSTGDTAQPGVFLIIAFMSGFSERFAQDILARVGGGKSPVESEQRHSDVGGHPK